MFQVFSECENISNKYTHRHIVCVHVCICVFLCMLFMLTTTVVSHSYGLQSYGPSILWSIVVGKIVSIFRSIQLWVMVSGFREHKPLISI